MVVQCGQCGTKFRLDESKIGPKGAKVRCSKCQHSFIVKRDEPSAPPGPAPETEVTGGALDGFNPDTEPTRPSEVRAARALAGPRVAAPQLVVPSPMDTLPTVPSPPSAALPVGAAAPASTAPQPALGAHPRTTNPNPPLAAPRSTGPLPPPSFDDLPLSGSSTPTRASPESPIHEVKTAVYTVPESIRAASARAATAGMPTDDASGIGLSVQDVAAINLDADDSATSVLSAGALAAARQASRDLPARPAPTAESPPDNLADIPSADADLIDGSEVALVGAAPATTASAAIAADPLGEGFEPLGGISADGTVHFGDGGDNRVDRVAGLEGSDGVAIGRLHARPTGKDVAPAAASTTAPSAQPAPEPPTQSGPSRGWSLGVKLVTTAVAVLVLALGVFVFQGGGRLDLSRIGLGKRGAEGRSAAASPIGYQDVIPVAMRSVLYPTRAGRQVLVFVGNAENRSGQPRRDIDAIAELKDREGRLVASSRSPLGLSFGPAELYELTDRESIAALWREAVSKNGVPVLQSRAQSPFTIVLLNPPAGLADMTHAVRLDKGEALAAAVPPPAPPPPISPEPGSGDPSLADSDKLKGKKAKLKGKKAKRKAKAPEEIE
jgi:predicted Zn finger-like uncharacterized protein